jgi:hypothetical protein
MSNREGYKSQYWARGRRGRDGARGAGSKALVGRWPSQWMGSAESRPLSCLASRRRQCRLFSACATFGLQRRGFFGECKQVASRGLGARQSRHWPGCVGSSIAVHQAQARRPHTTAPDSGLGGLGGRTFRLRQVPRKPAAGEAIMIWWLSPRSKLVPFYFLLSLFVRRILPSWSILPSSFYRCIPSSPSLKYRPEPIH